MTVLITLLLFWRLTAACGHLRQRYAPTNITIRFLRSKCGVTSAIAVALVLTLAYLLAGYGCSLMLERGEPGWLHIFVVLSIWNALKFASMTVVAPLSLMVRRPAEP